MSRELLQLAEDGRLKEFYNSYGWRQKSKQVLRRDRYECQRCRQRRKYKRAECVHHIREIKEHPHLALSDTNLVSLCKRCHNEIHEKAMHINRKYGMPVTPERW